MAGALGRRAPSDDEHIRKFPLTARILETVGPTAGVLGINWYPEFDHPFKLSDGHWYVNAPSARSQPRGGHCVAIKPRGVSDDTGWWDFYNQGYEGACVGFGCSRVMTLMNRRRYFARWLWDRAKATDEWPETNPGDDEGTSVRAALNILLKNGHVRWLNTAEQQAADADWHLRTNLAPAIGEGVAAYRWATSVEDMRQAVGYGDKQYLDILNSWGRDYPHLVRFPLDALERVFREDGEFAIPTDR
jgi:hypothetical protein